MRYQAFEVDYNGRCWRIGTGYNRWEVIKTAIKAHRESGGEYTVFVEDGEKVIYNKRANSASGRAKA